MNLVLAMVSLIGGAGILYLGVGLYANRKQRCPGCNERGLEMDPHEGHLGTGVNEKGERYPYSLSAYRCSECKTEWREYNNNGLVTKDAYDAGARTPPPRAIAKERS